MTSKETIADLEALLDEARGNLLQSTGGESVCAIHKHGNPSDFLKYNEGKEYIVRKVIALLNREATETEILSFLSVNRERFNSYKASRLTSSAWQAYADGGLDGIGLASRILKLPDEL